MKIAPEFEDPLSVLVIRSPVAEPPLPEEFRRIGRAALTALGFELDGERAVIKPNVTIGEKIGDPGSGITTHPAFVHGLVDHLVAHGTRRGGVFILEDPRNDDTDAPRDWRGTGYLEIASATGAKLRSPSRFTCVNRRVPDPLALPTLPVSRLAVAPDSVLINVPKLKTHNLGITTLCMKNLMGVVSGVARHYCSQAWHELPEAAANRERPKREWMDRAIHKRWQEGLARRLVDTARVVTPRLNVIEGVVGREGTGFQRGRNRSLGLAIAGINPVAVDAVASYLMGFDPERIVYLATATRAGLGRNRIAELSVYTVDDGAPRRLRDVEALRVAPPFRVISDIIGEEEGEF